MLNFSESRANLIKSSSENILKSTGSATFKLSPLYYKNYPMIYFLTKYYIKV